MQSEIEQQIKANQKSSDDPYILNFYNCMFVVANPYKIDVSIRSFECNYVNVSCSQNQISGEGIELTFNKSIKDLIHNHDRIQEIIYSDSEIIVNKNEVYSLESNNLDEFVKALNGDMKQALPNLMLHICNWIKTENNVEVHNKQFR